VPFLTPGLRDQLLAFLHSPVAKTVGEETQTTSLANVAQQGTVTTLVGSPPTASAPTEGLPADAVQGQPYEFASQPGVHYYLGPDNVWRASVLVRVG
jgi:hypothetical protein